MIKKKAPVANLQQETTKRILATLLEDFRTRKLSASDLHDTYEGISPNKVKAICCADGTISEVDFDLAFSDLEQDNLIDTGPKEHVENDPNSSLVMVGFFVSKRLHTCLSAEGYKAATRATPTRSFLTQHIHFSGSFHQSPIGVGEQVTQSSDITAGSAEMFHQLRKEIEVRIADEQQRSEALDRLGAFEAACDKPTRIERYTQLVGVLGDHITVLGFILTPLFQHLMQ